MVLPLLGAIGTNHLSRRRVVGPWLVARKGDRRGGRSGRSRVSGDGWGQDRVGSTIAGGGQSGGSAGILTRARRVGRIDRASGERYAILLLRVRSLLAQLAEHPPVKWVVRGSSPRRGALANPPKGVRQGVVAGTSPNWCVPLGVITPGV